jgi:hypothetical protein
MTRNGTGPVEVFNRNPQPVDKLSLGQKGGKRTINWNLSPLISANKNGGECRFVRKANHLSEIILSLSTGVSPIKG